MSFFSEAEKHMLIIDSEIYSNFLRHYSTTELLTPFCRQIAYVAKLAIYVVIVLQ